MVPCGVETLGWLPQPPTAKSTPKQAKANVPIACFNAMLKVIVPFARAMTDGKRAEDQQASLSTDMQTEPQRDATSRKDCQRGISISQDYKKNPMFGEINNSV